MFERINFQNGDFQMVTVPLSRHHLVNAYRAELQARIGEDSWMPEMDAELFQAFGIYYQKIADLMEPVFEAAELTFLSRHHFFVCTESVSHPELAEGELIRGLSQLELLLGFSYPEEKPAQKDNKVVISSGNPAQDLIADVLLVFKEQAPYLLDRYSLTYLNKLTVQAVQRQDPELQKKLQREKDVELFNKTQAKEALRAHYQRKGIPIPEDF